MPQLTSLLLQNGIPQEAITWLFILPVAVTFTVAARQVIGIKGLGIATPLLLGFAFSSLGAQAGIVVFAAALLVSFVSRIILGKARLLYLPKTGLIITSAVLTIAITLSFSPYKEGINLLLAGFSFVVIALSLEQFSALMLERGPRRTLAVLLETLLIALPASYLISSRYLADLVLAYPVFILLGLMVFNFLLGKWTGLRISEFIRFKSIIFK